MSLPTITPGALAMADGVIAIRSAQSTRSLPAPAKAAEDHGWFLDRVASSLPGIPEATVVVPAWPRDAADRLAGLAGWRVATTIDAATAWRSYTEDATGCTVHVGALDVMQAVDPTCWILGGSAVDMAARLVGYHAATGVPYRATPGVAGCAMIRRLADQAMTAKLRGSGKATAQPYWRWDRHPMTLDGVGDLRWRQQGGPTLGDRDWVHNFDTRWQYLAAAGVARLAWSPLEHMHAQPYDSEFAGYWQVRAEDVPPMLWEPRGSIVPAFDARRVGPDGLVWLTTPIMAYLNDLGINPEVVDSWTCGQSGRYLRTWSERMRDGLVAAHQSGRDADLYAALQQTYQQTIGMMQRQGGSIYRPDWAHTIIDTARANLLRKVDRVYKALKILPIRAYVDALFYVTDNTHVGPLADALGVVNEQQGGPMVGRMRHIKTQTVAAYITHLGDRGTRRSVRP